MKKLIVILMVLGLIFGMVGTAMAQTDSHQVTVTVSAINEIDVSDAAIALTITSATAGSEPASDTDTSGTLVWTTNEASKKITVESDLGTVTIKFTLNVLATSVSGGTAVTGGVTFDSSYTADTASDFITGVSETVGDCTLQYTASATAAQGIGTDTHTITYTITNG